MYIQKKHKKNIPNIMFSLVVLVGFSYLILASDKFFIQEKRFWVKADFLEVQDDKLDWYISLDNIIITNELSDKFTYIVQPWDTLSSIAIKFWTTVETIKKVNSIKRDNLKIWDKIIISEEDWIIYQIPQKTTLKAFASKYGLNIWKLKEINYISEDNYEFDKWDELFVPITNQEAQKLWLIVVPVYNKENKVTTKSTTKSWKAVTKKQEVFEPAFTWNGSDVVSKGYFKPNIQNGFYRGHCTRYVAIKKFPYTSKSKQSRIWWGNAKDWYRNAKEAWYSVGKTPKNWSIVVLRYWGSRYYYAWHVWIVSSVDWAKKRILIDEMNAVWRFVVSKRWIPMDWSIIWYIYY